MDLEWMKAHGSEFTLDQSEKDEIIKNGGGWMTTANTVLGIGDSVLLDDHHFVVMDVKGSRKVLLKEYSIK